MNKHIVPAVKVATLVVALSIGASYAFAWVGPTAQPPANNVTVSGGSALPTGTAGQTFRNDGTNWIANSVIFNNGTNVGVGTTTPAQKLEVAGNLSLNTATARLYLGTSGGYGLIQRGQTWGGTNTNLYFGETADTGATTFRGSGNTTFESKVGIGTTAPVELLHMKSFAPVVRLEKTGIMNWSAGNVTGNNYTIYPDSATNATFNITSTGNVGIGTTAPSRKLTVANAGAVSTNTQLLYLKQPNEYGYSFNIDDSITGRMYLKGVNAGVESDVMTFDRTNSNVGIGTVAPNRRLDVSTNGGSDGLTIGQDADNTQTIQTYIDSQWASRAAYASGCCNTLKLNPDVGVVQIGSASNISAGAKLDVQGGDASINGLNVGRGGGNGGTNSAFGMYALNANTSGAYNTAIGENSLATNSTGWYNTGIGRAALIMNTSGQSNTAVGLNASYWNTTGSNNTAMGESTLGSNTTGSNNSAFGRYAMLYNSTGYLNAAVGTGALQQNTTGMQNTAIGSNAMLNNTTGNQNTAFGSAALMNNISGGGNVAVGLGTMSSNTSGGSNSALGVNALYSNTTGIQNTASGVSALNNNTTGRYNTAVGQLALVYNTTGESNTALGINAGPSIGTLVNTTAIGANAVPTASNMVRIGDNSTVSVIQGRVAYSYPSDVRLKENISDYTHGLDFITKLRPVTYNLKSDVGAKITKQGFIAQEVEAIEIPFYGINKPASKDDFYSLSYSDFVVPLVNSVKELKVENDTLNAKVEKLQAENDALQSRIEKIEAKLK